ncbi:hypothetical protein TI03_03880, partial [Achromatium sp. WMS1]
MTAQSELLQELSALFSGNAEFLENLYDQYIDESTQLTTIWQQRFAEIRQASHETSHRQIRKQLQHLVQAYPSTPSQHISTNTRAIPTIAAQQQAKVLRLINSYRYRGHQIADLDPLRLTQVPTISDLDPKFYQLTTIDLEKTFHTGSLYAPDYMKLQDIITLCQEVYCKHLGFEYMHITDTSQKRWLQ